MAVSSRSHQGRFLDWCASYKTLCCFSSRTVVFICCIIALQCSHSFTVFDFLIPRVWTTITPTPWGQEDRLRVLQNFIALISTMLAICSSCGLMGIIHEKAYGVGAFCWSTIFFVILAGAFLLCYSVSFMLKFFAVMIFAAIWLSCAFICFWIFVISYAEYRQIKERNQLNEKRYTEDETEPILPVSKESDDD